MFWFFWSPTHEVFGCGHVANWVLGEEPRRGVSKFIIEAAADVALNESFFFQFVKIFAGGVLGYMYQ